MVKPSEGGQDSHTYQQALDDFGITQLLCRISNYSDADFDTAWMHLTQQEIESIAALLIQQLTANLKGNLIASYLNILRNAGGQIISDLPTPELKAQLDHLVEGVTTHPRQSLKLRI